MFNFFKKKKESSNCRYETYKKLKKFRDIGEKFNYLSIEMVVTAHYEINIYSFETIARPVLKADYVDKNGIIRERCFCIRELPGLIKENENDNKK